MSELGHVSKWQALFRNYDGKIFTQDGLLVRTTEIARCPTNDFEILGDLSQDMSRAKEDRQEHMRQRSQYFSSEDSESSEDDEVDAQSYLEDMLSDPEQRETPDVSKSQRRTIPPNNIELREITSDSELATELFPRSFHCSACNHYEIIEDVEEKDSFNCPERGCSGTLFQINLVFGCPRCASVEHLLPNSIDAEDLRNGKIPCEECDFGHYHLIHHRPLGNSYWECSNSGCQHTLNLERYCNICSIPEEATSEMRPMPGTANSLSVPRINNYVRVDSDQITIDRLRTEHEDNETTDTYHWSNSDLQLSVNEIFKNYLNVAEVFSIKNINNITTLWGYRAGFNSNRTELEDHERLIELFDVPGDNNTYKAYIAQTKGRGLVFELNKEKISGTIHSNTNQYPEEYNYSDIAEDELTRINDWSTGQVIEHQDEFPLIGLLHAYEHALFSAATSQIGMDEVVGSKMMISAGTLVLYEREDIGAGGLAQITLSRSDGTHTEIKRFARETAEEINTCSKNCSHGCLACTFIPDFHCHPFLEHEVDTWVPANALQNRHLAKVFIQS